MHRRLTMPVILAGLALSGAAEAQLVPPVPRTAPAPPAAPPRAGPTQPVRPALERDLSTLPPLVAAMRERILEAARSGDPERVRIAIERNETPPVLLRGRRGDAVALLKEKSADPDGREILARLVDLLEAPHARVHPGRPALERDLSTLPPLVAAMRERILEAARSGDPERVRIAIERNETPPVLLRGRRGDAVALLKEKSADPDGREILARLVDLLEAPHARVHPGRPQEMFVWPGHAERDLAALTPEETVELLRAVPYAALRESLEKKAYLGDRIGIGPDGTWHYFLTGP